MAFVDGIKVMCARGLWSGFWSERGVHVGTGAGSCHAAMGSRMVCARGSWRELWSVRGTHAGTGAGLREGSCHAAMGSL